MTKQFSFLQLFSLTDGRLSRTIEDVEDILNHVCDTGEDLMTHHLPVAFDYFKSKSPEWFKNQIIVLEEIKEKLKTNDFLTLIDYIETNRNPMVNVPQLKDEFDTSDFANYMIDNSIFLKRFEKR